jgi:anaerobic ribonucleoside-triphosphate reductase activating protein
MKIASIEYSNVNGEGNRLVIFMTGCIHNCKGCHSPLLQNYKYGVDWNIQDVHQYIKDRKQWIDGITFSGGDPLYQLNQLKDLLKLLRADDDTKYINTWVYTGYTIDQIPPALLSLIDIVVDGKYVEGLSPAKWRGSNNQKIYRKVQGHIFEQVPESDVMRFDISGIPRK